jgi:hypothetical protein
MAIALKGSEPEAPLFIEVEEKDGEVRLLHRGFAFVVCRTEGVEHIVEVRDKDCGVTGRNNIQALCWRR